MSRKREVKTSQIDLLLDMHEGTDGLQGGVQYNPDLFDRATIVRIIEHFQNLLEASSPIPTNGSLTCRISVLRRQKNWPPGIEKQTAPLTRTVHSPTDRSTSSERRRMRSPRHSEASFSLTRN